MSKQPIVIAPSILAADLARLGEEVHQVLSAGAEWVHFDVMDNHYVPNLSFGPMICKALRDYGITAPLDVHLMVKPVDRIIPDFIHAGADWVSVHPEATEHLDRTLDLIQGLGAKAGLVLNPATPLSALDWVMHRIDLILVMSVNSGYGGQRFLPSVLPKVAELRARIDASDRPIRLSIDGGITSDTITQAAAAGADTFVAGSAVFGASDYAAAIASLKERARLA